MQSYQLEQLGEWAELIRNDIQVHDYNLGWFKGTIRACVRGIDVYRWILTHVESNEKKAKQICQKMLEKEIISSVKEKSTGLAEFQTEDIYRMYMDRDDIADNMLRRWKD